jgi:hypothetical protein
MGDAGKPLKTVLIVSSYLLVLPGRKLRTERVMCDAYDVEDNMLYNNATIGVIKQGGDFAEGKCTV